MAKKQLDSLATILDDKHKMLGDNLDFVIEKVLILKPFGKEFYLF